MSLFSKLFNSPSRRADPDIQFGRYTNPNKSDEKYIHWQKSIECFENEKFLKSYAFFLDFLTDEDQKNVTYAVKKGQIEFTIFQGSKIINGRADFATFKAEAKIVKTTTPDKRLFKLLLNQNYHLKYSRYCLDEEGNISLVFDTFVEDGSPHKIYLALKELATEADRKDDILMHSFEGLLPINFHHTGQINYEEKYIKFKFFLKRIRLVLNELESGQLDPELYPGGISFLLLDLLYTIDYHIKPEGKIMDSISECTDLYFNDNFIDVFDKNNFIIKKVSELNQMEFEEFEKELYEVNSTFAVTISEGQNRLIEIIDAQMQDFEWYYQNKNAVYSQAICGYIVGFSLHSFKLPEVSKSLLKLFYRIIYSDFYEELGFKKRFILKGKIVKKAVISEIKRLDQAYKSKEKQVNINYKNLVFDETSLFAKSYLLMVRNINYKEATVQ